jgi:hypothetical protein
MLRDHGTLMASRRNRIIAKKGSLPQGLDDVLGRASVNGAAALT